MPLGPQDLVAAPALSPPPNGILRSVTVIEHSDELHWGGTLGWVPEGGADAFVFDPCVGNLVPATFSDGVSNSTTTYTSATAAFTAADVGKGITGTNIPAGTVIASVSSATTVILSQAATASASGLSFSIAGRIPATPGNRPAQITYTPFVVDAFDACSTFGFQAADYEGRARRALAARESKAVGKEWWIGALFPLNPHLAKATGTNGPNTTTLAGGTAQTLRLGLSLLVQALADANGGTGIIWARPFLVELWFGLDLVRVGTDGKLYTASGHLVVPQAGSPGTGPTAQAITATSEWAWATDSIEVHRGPVEVFAPGVNGVTVDRTLNEVTIRAQRLYAIAWNGLVNVAVNIDPTSNT
jgi:hypothetical protein